MKPPRRPHTDSGRPGKADPRHGDGRAPGPHRERAGPGGPPRRDGKDRPFGLPAGETRTHGGAGRAGAAGAGAGGSGAAGRGPGGGGRGDERRPQPPARPRQDEGYRGERLAASPRQPLHAAPPRAAREAPGGSLWLYGLHAVAAALANPARRLRRLLLTEEAEAAVAARLPRPWAVAVERTERGRLDHLLGPGAIHQGAALLVDPLQPPSLQSVVARPGPVLVLDQVTDPRNVGAILRAAAAFGVAAVITQERNAPEETGALAKAASGALETMPMLRAVNIARTLVALRAAGFWIVGLDAGGGVLGGAALAGRRVALVLGSEGEGLRRLTRDTCDEVAGIAMPGATASLESLNVATAAAIALYELARRP